MNINSKITASECTGCGACYNKCPFSAIDMVADKEGFISPVVDPIKCTDCGLCLLSCAANSRVEPNSTGDCYAVWADSDTRAVSSSGGFFSVLANYILDNNGAIFGAAYADDYKSVNHICVTKRDDLQRLRGSKYLASDTKTSYKEAKEYLEKGSFVLFSGTPCQIAGLQKYLSKDYENLYTADIVCHGVPSPLAYKSYLEETADGGEIKKIDFREKAHFGWGTAISIFQEDGQVYRNNCYDDPYLKGFLSGLTTRKCCSECKYTTLNRVGDFTLGDFWGVAAIDQNLDDKKGTSLALINTRKAKQLFSELKERCALAKEVKINDLAEIAKTRNGQLLHPSPRHPSREVFFNKLGREGFRRAYTAATQKYDIGYVGWWNSDNYGSALTSYAMYKTLEKMGKTVIMLEHPGLRPDVHKDQFGMQFAKHFYNLTDITTTKQNNRFNSLCDTFLVGSDQLWNWWNIQESPGYFFLDFAYKDHKKIAYATSFGSAWSSFPESIKLKIGYYLSRFDAISVRENEGVDICRDEFSVPATQVMDPVFLCDREFYNDVTALSKCKEEGSYLFSYMLDPTEDKVRLVRETASKKNLPYRIIIDPLRNNDNNTKQYVNDLIKSDPNIITNLRIEDWLYYISNSEYVVTDSFHGFCFSIIYKKPMIVYINNRRGRSRFESIANNLNVKDRIVETYDEAITNGLIDKDVPFDTIQRELARRVEISKKWLGDSLDARKREISVHELMLWKCLEHDRRLHDTESNISLLEKRIANLEEKINSSSPKKRSLFKKERR